jgi:hypothetical protein
MATRRATPAGPRGDRSRRAAPVPAPAPPAADRSDRLVRLQIFAAFVVPLLLLGVWLSSKGFFRGL